MKLARGARAMHARGQVGKVNKFRGRVSKLARWRGEIQNEGKTIAREVGSVTE